MTKSRTFPIVKHMHWADLFHVVKLFTWQWGKENEITLYVWVSLQIVYFSFYICIYRYKHKVTIVYYVIYYAIYYYKIYYVYLCSLIKIKKDRIVYCMVKQIIWRRFRKRGVHTRNGNLYYRNSYNRNREANSIQFKKEICNLKKKVFVR